jgi:hypothetical protein
MTPAFLFVTAAYSSGRSDHAPRYPATLRDRRPVFLLCALELFPAGNFAFETTINKKQALMLQGHHSPEQKTVEDAGCHPPRQFLAVTCSAGHRGLSDAWSIR